ncbi:coiled-coil domain-containing protein 66-like [Uloborus diversus]|uniref:coiled-coil domain-containing protein 66-like n=1 Tax=Uloborus diversus TaxID=327109 RepID=UPI00240986F9|nr:coiled-coil domain-containing protein 66-like [Uloborus diversus]
MYQQLLMVHTSTAVPYQQSMASPSRFLPEPSPGQCHSFLPNKTFSQYNCVAQPIKPVPHVFKSSIAFGNGDSESVSSDYFKRQQWLQELGEEEQRKAQEQMQLGQMSDPMWMNGCKDDTESISVSVDGSVMPGVARNYIRGQGFQLDPVSAALAEERRQKAQEYQRAIREQMEEKQRRLEAERERKKLEEEAEERRLELERARIHAEYEQEQMRIKQKAEMEERKHQVLVSAVQQAQAQAEMEKKTRKIQKMLPPPPPPESVLASPKRTQEKQDLPSLVEDKLKIEDKIEEPSDSPSSRRRESSRASETESCISEQKEFGVQTSEDRRSSYVVDRVLTPSIFRVRAKTGRGKDCGTQTEAQFGKYAAEDAESTESNTSSFHSPRRIVRVQHSKPCKVQRRIVEMPEERPKWGVNQPSKSYVRMTERDPHFSKRKRMQELRRQHWARELAAQKTGGQLSTRRSNVTTSYPSLRGRRGASSSDCTLGYSSSEFETRSCRPFRSNSTPRYRQPSGFRSDHGSAETVAYMEAVPIVAHPMLRRRESQSSDNLPSIVGGSEPSPSRRIEGYGHPSYSLPPMRRKWHSQETFHPGIFHTYSPPHLLHRPLMEPFRPGPRPIIQRLHRDMYVVSLQRRKWSDQESFDLESVVRSRVEEGSRASSAESSEKSEKSSAASSAGSSARKSPANQNPLVCPEVVTGRPTPRQDRILQNLSSLRQGLLKKQKELESLIRRPPPYFS